MIHSDFNLFSDQNPTKTTKPICAKASATPNNLLVKNNAKINTDVDVKKEFLDWVLKPGKKAWKYNDPLCIKEFHERTKNATEIEIAEEIIGFLKDKSKWVFYPSVAMVSYYLLLECFTTCVVSS